MQQITPIHFQTTRVLPEYDVFIHTSDGTRIPAHTCILVCLQFQFNSYSFFLHYYILLILLNSLWCEINNE